MNFAIYLFEGKALNVVEKIPARYVVGGYSNTRDLEKGINLRPDWEAERIRCRFDVISEIHPDPHLRFQPAIKNRGLNQIKILRHKLRFIFFSEKKFLVLGAL